jgi:hypothetical protein
MAGGPLANAPGGNLQTSKALSAITTVKAAPGAILQVSVLVAGSGAGAVYDCAVTGDASTSNAVAPILNTVGVQEISIPCLVGVTVKPGPGQQITVSYQ